MVHRSIGNDSRMANELYIKRVLLALEDFLFFSLYSFSCIAKQVTTLKQHRLLSCLDLFETNLDHLFLFCFLISHFCYQYYLRPTPPVTESSLRSMEMSCRQMVRMNDNHWAV
jgi:hypothetical protein